MAYKITIFLKNTQKNISFSFELMGVNSLRDEVNGCMPCFFILSKHNNPCPSFLFYSCQLPLFPFIVYAESFIILYAANTAKKDDRHSFAPQFRLNGCALQSKLESNSASTA